MVCKKCNCADNYGRKYCRECGARLGVICLHCGFTNDEHDKYCGGCGISTSIKSVDNNKIDNQSFEEGHKRFFSQYDSKTLTNVIAQAERLKSVNEEKVISTFQQDDIDKLFSE
jgi:hypothetical protein